MKKLPTSPNVKVLFFLALFIFFLSPKVNDTFAQATPEAFEISAEPKIQGQVIDENGKAMPGIAILVKGSTTGTATDMNGFFSLDLKKFVDQKVILVLSFPNYSAKEVVIDMSKLPMDIGQIKMKKG